ISDQCIHAMRSCYCSFRPTACTRQAAEHGDDTCRLVELLHQDQFVIDLKQTSREVGDRVYIYLKGDVVSRHRRNEVRDGSLIPCVAEKLLLHSCYHIVERDGHMKSP